MYRSQRSHRWKNGGEKPSLRAFQRTRARKAPGGKPAISGNPAGRSSWAHTRTRRKAPEEAPMQQTVTTAAERPSPSARPSRAQIQPAALELLSRHSAGLLATARRYSVTPEDAEDAYQRGVEILLTKAPTTTEDELLPWLKTVVKHEAFAVAKASGRAVPA